MSDLKKRIKARQLLMQALYQWHMTGMEVSAIQSQFHEMNDPSTYEVDYFDTLFLAILKSLSTVDATFESYLDRQLSELNPIELAVLRLGTYELLQCPEIPYRVVLKETISLTKAYGSTDGYKYINGVLNQVAHQIRTAEVE